MHYVASPSRVWLLLSGIAVLVLLGVAGCGEAGGTEESGSESAISPAQPPVDVTFRAAVLEDGVVTRYELEQAYARMFECLREGRAIGEVWLDLGLSPTYAIRLAVPDNTGTFPDDRELAGELNVALMTYCERAFIDPLWRVYAEQKPETKGQGEQKRRMAVACLKERLPDLAVQVSDEWDLDTLRSWVYDKTVGEEAVRADSCVDYYGIPFRDLEDM